MQKLQRKGNTSYFPVIIWEDVVYQRSFCFLADSVLSVWKGLNGYVLVSTSIGKYKKTSTFEFFQLEQLFGEAAYPIWKRHFSLS